MNCTKCGSILPDNARFCNKCGKPVGNMQNFCQKCGAQMSADQRFCNKCGAPNQAGAAQNQPVQNQPAWNQPVQDPYSGGYVSQDQPAQNGYQQNTYYGPGVFLCKSPTVMWYMGLRGYDPPKSNGTLFLYSDKLEYKAISKIGFFGEKGNAVFGFNEIANVSRGDYPDGASIVVTLYSGMQQTYGTNAAKGYELCAFLDQIHAAMGR